VRQGHCESLDQETSDGFDHSLVFFSAFLFLFFSTLEMSLSVVAKWWAR